MLESVKALYDYDGSNMARYYFHPGFASGDYNEQLAGDIVIGGVGVGEPTGSPSGS